MRPVMSNANSVLKSCSWVLFDLFLSTWGSCVTVISHVLPSIMSVLHSFLWLQSSKPHSSWAELLQSPSLTTSKEWPFLTNISSCNQEGCESKEKPTIWATVVLNMGNICRRFILFFLNQVMWCLFNFRIFCNMLKGLSCSTVGRLLLANSRSKYGSF